MNGKDTLRSQKKKTENQEPEMGRESTYLLHSWKDDLFLRENFLCSADKFIPSEQLKLTSKLHKTALCSAVEIEYTFDINRWKVVS